MYAQVLAKAIDHALLQPSLLDSQFDAGCDVAVKFEVAAVCVKSIDVARAVRRVEGSRVAVCAVVGFPHGNAKTSVVCEEARVAMGEGAREIDVVLPLSAALSGRHAEVLHHLQSVNGTVTSAGGSVKVILETGLIPSDELKIQLCELCVKAKVAFVKTSTGFAMGTTGDGAPKYLGATEHDVRLLAQHARPHCEVKASGQIRTLAQVKRFMELGATRIGTGATAEILGSLT